MTQSPLPLAAPPHDTVRPPKPRPTDDHRTHLSGGARYASAKQMRPAQGAGWWATERGRPASAGNGWPPSGRMQS
jgi:hypothetical protein